METYHLKVAGLERDLPVCPLGNGVSIAGFVMFSDVELTIACATELLKSSGLRRLFDRGVQGYPAGL